MGPGTPTRFRKRCWGRWVMSCTRRRWISPGGRLRPAFCFCLPPGLQCALSNSGFGPGFNQFWDLPLGIIFDGAQFVLSLRHWINDGLLVIFFLVVGLEIKREFTVGHLASARAAMLPVAAAIGGMVVPAMLYLILVPSGPEGAWSRGWGVPMATDTAFAVALIAMMGKRVPGRTARLSHRRRHRGRHRRDRRRGHLLFHRAAIRLPHRRHRHRRAACCFERGRRLPRHALHTPGHGLWICVHESGIHASLAGIVLALFIPTRPPPQSPGAHDTGRRHPYGRDAARQGSDAVWPLRSPPWRRWTPSTTGSSPRLSACCA